MKKIILITEGHFTKRDQEKWGVKFFLKKNFKIDIINVAPLTRPLYFYRHKPADKVLFPSEKIFKNKLEIIKEIQKIPHKSYIFLLIGKKSKSIFIFKEIEKRKLRYIIIEQGNLPIKGKSFFQLIYLSIRYPISLIKHLIDLFKRNSKYGKKPYYTFCAGKKYYKSAKERKKSKVIKIPSYDYDNKIIKGKSLNFFKNSKDYAVYLDAGYNHPDFLDRNERFPPETFYKHKEYYKPLNNFFKKFIQISKLELKVAAHPRSIYKTKSIKYGKLYFNKTLELISQCKVVLLHRSTALNFAVLFEKPIIFLTQDSYTLVSKNYTDSIANYFEKKPINLSPEKNFFNKTIYKNELKVDKKIYKNFKKDFIVDINKPKETSYQIIYKYIKNKI